MTLDDLAPVISTLHAESLANAAFILALLKSLPEDVLPTLRTNLAAELEAVRVDTLNSATADRTRAEFEEAADAMLDAIGDRLL